MRLIGCWLVVMVCGMNVFGQGVKREIMYRYLGADSVLVYQKERREDAAGALLSKRDYFYNGTPSQNPLWREEGANYMDGLLTQYITHYRTNDEPQTERLDVRYLRYAADDDSCKILSIKKYDFGGELTKEDTSTFNEEGYLIGHCAYVYTGSTSLVCDVYKVNKKGLTTKEASYVHWNTVSMRGKAKVKKSLRASYKYKYNKRGQRVSGKGHIYKSKYKEVRKYDEMGLLAYELRTIKRKEKTRTVVDSVLRTYTGGRLVTDILVESNARKREQVNTYKDSLLVSTEYKGKQGKLVERKAFKHHANGKTAEETKEKYDESGALRYVVVSKYSEKGELLSEEQSNQGRLVSLIEYTYDSRQRPTSKTMRNAAKTAVERTYYSYE